MLIDSNLPYMIQYNCSLKLEYNILIPAGVGRIHRMETYDYKQKSY